MQKRVSIIDKVLLLSFLLVLLGGITHLAMLLSPVTSAIPAELIIPKIHIQANIEQVGNNSSGAMDVPRHGKDVAWYMLGPKPGEAGKAVIDGHLDFVDGKPAVFYNLSKLEKNDKIMVKDTTGKQYTFIVFTKKVYSQDKFPSAIIFGSSKIPQLNLITCSGDYIVNKHMYLDRVVVFTTLQK